MNMVALVDGQPRLLNLKQFLEHFLEHRREVVTRRTRFELRKARERGHILEGLAVALSNVDEIIALIKASADAARGQGRADGAHWRSPLVEEMLDRARRRRRAAPTGCRRNSAGRTHGGYRLSDAQAQAILELRLQRLTGLEQDKITGEYREVMALIVDLLDILAKPERVTRDHPRRADRRSRDQFGDKRRSRDRRAGRGPLDRGPDRAAGHGRHAVARRLHEGAAGRRVPRAEARRPRQAGDGDEGGRLRRAACSSRTRTTTSSASPTAAASTGSRSTTCRRAAARRAASRSSTSCRWSRTRRSPRSCRCSEFTDDQYVFMATRDGHGQEDAAVRLLAAAPVRHHRGRPGRGRPLIGVALTDGKHDVMLFSSGGKAVRFDENDVRPMGRNAHGVRGMIARPGADGDLDAGRRGRGAVGADRDRERLRQAHADRRVHAPRPRHQGHDRDPAVRAQRPGRGRGARPSGRRGDADLDRRRADPHPGEVDPRDEPLDAGRHADQPRRRREARRPRARGRARRRKARGGERAGRRGRSDATRQRIIRTRRPTATRELARTAPRSTRSTARSSSA